MSLQLYPSILSADFGNLESICELINESKADGFHLDVMDGIFVPNISFGFPVIKAIKRHALKPLDVHLMITEPGRYIEEFKDAGANILTIHIEACKRLHQTITAIKENEMKACIAINPGTPITCLKDLISEVDSFCIMSVNPGFGGQKFIENTYIKIQQLRKMITFQKSNAMIKVDGGVDLTNDKRLVQTGADILVAGSSIFNSEEPLKMIERYKGF